MDYEDISKGSQESMPINVSFSGLLATLPNVELDQTGVCAWEKEIQIQSSTHPRWKHKVSATVSQPSEIKSLDVVMPNVGLDALPMELQPSFALVESLNPPPVKGASTPKRKKQISKPKKVMKESGVLSSSVSKVICTSIQTHSFRTLPLFSPGSTSVVCYVSPSLLIDPLHVCSVLCPLSFSQIELCRSYFSSPICPKHPLY